MVVSSTATDDDAAPRVVEDCRGVLQVLSDGTILQRDGFCINSYATPHFHATCSRLTVRNITPGG